MGASMSSEREAVAVRNNEEASRYETTVGGHLAKIDYRLGGSIITLVHTEVPPALEGQGVGSALAAFALDEARARGYTVVPRCPFVAAYIRRHPKYQPLVGSH